MFAPSDYALELIAQEATELRDAARLLHLAPGGAIADHLAELDLHPSTVDAPGDAP